MAEPDPLSVEGTRTFASTGEAYDTFMGRYSQPLAVGFASFAQVRVGQRALDVGCGPGALTRELVRRLGADAVAACEPSESFVGVCRERNPGVDVRRGAAETLPFDDNEFDLVISQLVLHFASDPDAAAAQMVRVLRPGGVVAACVWNFQQGMELLRAFWDAEVSVEPTAPDEEATSFGRDGELAQWLSDAGLVDVTEERLTVTSEYRDFDELWSGFLAGVGPPGRYVSLLSPPAREALRVALHQRLGSPTGAFTLAAVANAARGFWRPE